MITNVVLASVLAGAVASLLYAVRIGDRPLEVISKTVASLSFVVVACVRWSSGDTVGGWLLAGLALCALGDVMLLHGRAFDIGLSAFVLGHLFYIAGFRNAAPVGSWWPAALLPVVVAGAAAIAWLWPHLGRRRLTVSTYVIVISFMLWGGLSSWWTHVLPWTAAAGPLFFYVSDLAVARHRFIRPEYTNRALGLPLYYAGQFLIALTIGSPGVV